MRSDDELEHLPHVNLIGQSPAPRAAARILGHSSDAITKEFSIEKDRTTPDGTHILQSFAGKATTTPSNE